MQLMKEVKSGYSILKISLEEIPGLMDMILDVLDKDETDSIYTKSELSFLINFTESLSIIIGQQIVLKLTNIETQMFEQIYEKCESLVN